MMTVFASLILAEQSFSACCVALQAKGYTLDECGSKAVVDDALFACGILDSQRRQYPISCAQILLCLLRACFAVLLAST